MIKKIIKKYGKNAIAPAVTSIFLFVLHQYEASKQYDYFAAFAAEGLVLVSIYLLSIREISDLNKKIEVNEKKQSDFIDSELKKVAELLSSIDDNNLECKEQAAKLYSAIIKEKTALSQKQFKKHKDESDRLTIRYNEALKDMEDSEASISRKIDEIKDVSAKSKEKEERGTT